MPNIQASFDRRVSQLVRLFVERSGFGPAKNPEDVMASLIEGVRGTRGRRQRGSQIQLFFDERKIKSIEVLSDLNCDGLIEPVGQTFAEGFRMLLKKGSPEPRTRFTMAHEICHTFFYELVPEMKFIPHDPDEQEERLCNFGAAALLIPPHVLRRQTVRMSVSLETLQYLAEGYAVSVPTMLLRLRALGLWQCEFSRWRRMLNGTFTLDRLYGGKQAAWKWTDDSILAMAWESKDALRGRSFISYEDHHGVQRYKPISYQARRSADGIAVLWGNTIATRMSAVAPPLFAGSQ
jgi:hypothetical protein